MTKNSNNGSALFKLLSDSGCTTCDEKALNQAVASGHNDAGLVRLIHWFSTEFKKYEPTSQIQIIPENSSGQDFMFELRSFIEELGCPKSLISAKYRENGDQQYWSRVITFLCSELLAAKMNFRNVKSRNRSISKSPEEQTAEHMKTMLMALGFSKPPPQITSVQLFNKVEAKIKEKLSTCSADILGKPIFSGVLTEKQWNTLEQINETLCCDYQARREMLLKRLDVTVQSFTWSDQVKKMEDDIATAFCKQRQQLSVESKIRISDVLCSREDLIVLTKTSDSNDRKNTKCAINKFIIGKVPDRGGRPSEQRAPPPEMPSWQARKDDKGGGFRGGRGGGGGCGDYGGRGGGRGDYGGRVGGRGDNSGGRGGGQGSGRMQGGWSRGGGRGRGRN